MTEVHYGPGPQVPRKKRPTGLIVLLSVLTVLMLCGLGVIAIGLTEDSGSKVKAGSTPAATTNAPAAVAATSPAVSVPTTPAAPPPPPPPPPPPAPPSIEDGVWTVGVDFPPGSYRTTTNVSSRCYWKISKTGSNGQDIIANGAPEGGRPSVTLKVGQDFETEDCGKWSKVG